ncbi:FACT complex subunit SSRP1 [Trichinella britovi]|uniref:FACT complex subunit SSRP1 n=1 Tax=Trichinella britovi TaxID=45882 RepID=A0A0V1CKI1_TRIBR|nr:FACT complex subunit SSRP1 [Trichinella britovi]
MVTYGVVCLVVLCLWGSQLCYCLGVINGDNNCNSLDKNFGCITMNDFQLEFNDVCMENLGFLNPGKIKLSNQSITFKNTKTGKVEHISANDIDHCHWVRLADSPALKCLLKSGPMYRFGGFKDSDFDRLSAYLKKNWNMELKNIEPCITGTNQATANFIGSVLEFENEGQLLFDIPLANVNNCSSAKNEVIMEFNQNDECAVSLMEMRLYISADPNTEEDPAEEFKRKIAEKAGFLKESGKELAVLEQVLCATPRGRYDIKIYPTMLALHGKTFDYKIPISSILRLFLLPHQDGRRMFFVIGLDPPVKQGQTRYHFLIMDILKDDEVDLELGLPEDVLKEKYNGELPRQLSGPLFEIISRIMKCLVRKQITVPGNFVGHTGTPAVGCAYKSAGGFLYPLQHGFLYVHKPPVYVRLEEISCINFARSHVTTKSFDFEIQTKQGNIFTFTSIMKEEYGKLYDFVVSKGINITNTGKRLETTENLFKGSSDEEGERDHYAEQLKSEAREKEENNENDSDESEDSDYDPEKGEVRKNSSESSSSSSDSEASGGSEDESSDQEEKNKKKTKNVSKKAKSSSSAESDEEKDDDDSDDDDDDDQEEEEEEEYDDEKPKPKKAHNKKAVQPPKPKKQKKVKEGPKRNKSAYMFYLMENRSKFKKPGMSFADVSKAAAEQWKKLKDKSVSIEKHKWENLAAVDRKRYLDELKEFKKKGGGNIVATKSSKSSTPVKASKIKSREIIEDSDSSSDEKMDTSEVSSDE